MALRPSPAFMSGFDSRRHAFKRCMTDGTWFLHPEGNKTWTNYTDCIDMEDFNFRSTVNNIYVIGYLISTVALVIALAIFHAFYRNLKCTRIRTHMQFFASLLLNNICWVIWYLTVMNDVTVLQNNKGWCQVLHLLTYYFMVSSYFWMFCEGLNLHIAIVVVFVVEDVAMRWYNIIGWVVSMLVVGVYGLVRFYTPGATELCWFDDSPTLWIVQVPLMVSLFASAVFLIHVVKVVWIKLRNHPDQNAAIMKTVRGALSLIPLFGLNFVLVPLRPEHGTSAEKVFEVFSALLISLEGLFVAVLYCFTNNEVQTTIKEQIARYRNRHEVIPMTGESLKQTRDVFATQLSHLCLYKWQECEKFQQYETLRHVKG